MGQLRAFVGHSFLEADKQVVSSILGMLDSISKLMTDFAWDHALGAEPKVLSQKVKEKMEGKNLFIGICTAKERAIDPAYLRRSWMARGDLVAGIEKFQAKTSDWIIQEIGMAVGRDMHIILLLEAGVREPGGLQGDLEYISFDRLHPENCLEKIADMLRSLAPLVAKAGATQQSPNSTQAEMAGERVPQFLVPDPSWTGESYAGAYGLSIQLEKEAAERQIAESFNKSAFASDLHAQSAFQAAAISARANMQKGEWVVPLQRLAAQYPNTAGPFRALARRFDEARDHSLAARNYEIAAQFATTTSQKMRLLVDAAEQSRKAGESDQHERLLALANEIIRSNPEIEAAGMSRLAELWKATGDIEMFTACAERALEISPDTLHPRFDLAYTYSEKDLDNHALFHYRQYLKVHNSPEAWNNLGVAAAACKLPITAISSYQAADREGNSLATSNLASALLEAGFLNEATTLCQKAITQPDANPRLFEIAAQCNRAETDEAAKETEALEATTHRRTVLRTIGRASIQKREESLPERWQGPNCLLTASIVGSYITLKGTYTRSIEAGLGSLFSLSQHKGERTYTEELTGTLVGRAFIGKIKTTSDLSTTSLLGVDEGRECIGTLTQASTKFELFKNNKDRISLSAIP